jgi:hypothetical protein
MKTATKIAIVLLFLLIQTTAAQDVPGKIRGYKVFDAKITLENTTSTAADPPFRIGNPVIVDLGLSGVTFDVTASIRSLGQEGKVDLLTFSDLRINGNAVEVEEYSHPFSINKVSRIELPVPARVFVRTSRIALAAFKELVETKTRWNITGTVFVFGKFKKFGMNFKRVVPVRINLTIANPLPPLT